MNFSYPDVEQYLENYEIDGGKIYCQFKAPNGEIFESSSPIRASKTIGNKIQKEVARVAKRQARRTAGRLIRGALGGGTMGRMGSKIARGSVGSMAGGASQKSYSTADKEEAITKAFARVARNFGISRRGERLEKSDRPSRRERSERGERRERGSSRSRSEESSDSEYQNQLNAHPVSNVFQQEILARFLVELAGADGKITPDEKEFLGEIIPRRFGSIEDLQAKDSISRLEVEELDSKVRETIFLIGWSLALADYDVDHAEMRLLLTYGELFGIPDHRKEELAKMAKFECLEQAITPDTGRDDLFALADGIDLTREDAERCLINYKKKMY